MIPNLFDFDGARLRRWHSGPRLALACLLALILAGCSNAASDSNTVGTLESVSETVQSSPTVQPTPLSLKSDTPTPVPAPTEAPTAATTATLEPPPTVIRTQLVTTIDTLLESEDGLYGVVILDQSGEYRYSRNADIPFVAASLYKLVLLADIYAKVEAGDLSLDMELPLLSEYFDDQFAAEDGYYMLEDEGGVTTLDAALFGAGAYSSNIAAQILLHLTSTESLRATAERLEMWDSWFNVNPAQDIPDWPNQFIFETNPESEMAVAFINEQAEFNLLHITTPNDIAHYWVLLVNGEVISPDASSAILSILREQVVTDRLPYLLPQGYSTANKTGNLYHVVHDSGIIENADGSIVVAALSQNESDDDHGAQVIQRIALAAIGDTELPGFTVDDFTYPESTD